MKNFLLVACLLVCGLAVHAQSNNYKISGKIKGLTADSVSMVVLDATATNGFYVKKMKVTNESFSGSFHTKSMCRVNIYLNMKSLEKNVSDGYIPSISAALMAFVYPGANIHFIGNVDADFADGYPTGDKLNVELAQLNREVYPIQNQLVNFEVKRINKIVTDTSVLRKMRDTASRLRKEMALVKRKFLAEQPNSVAAAWLLGDMLIRSELPFAEAESIFEKMANPSAPSPFYQNVSERIGGIKATRLGNFAPAIVSKSTPNGQEISLASFKGKWVIIDFWGTWCKPCMDGMPKMREYLEKYQSKLEILGIAVEDEAPKWKSVIKSANLNWHHILSIPSENFALKYNIAGYPTKLIIDPTGKIVERYVGEDNRIYQKLDELLK